ncbi:proton-coupled folate transporter-like isoform X2 [Clytia hemisphaerica]|uniref:proton-coupled folate transporter-like isoform X2 n=1 Tax=Clytia hemisphaerica TaxID=252671 RepID=UPI0034D62B6B
MNCTTNMVSLTATSFSDSFNEYNQIRQSSLLSRSFIHEEPTTEKTNRRKTTRQVAKQIFKSITIEPVTFFYACALILHAPLIQQYIYHRLSEDFGLPSNIKVDKSSCNVDTESETDLSIIDKRKQVQSMTSYIYLGIILAAALPSFFMALLLGSWSDKVGRKIIILLPVIGGLLDSVCILITMATRGSLYLLFIGSFCNGVCGFFTTMILAVFSYMADTTTEEERALRLGIVEAVAFTSGMISHISSGWWIQHLGFKAPYIFITTLHLISLTYIITYLPESSTVQLSPKRIADLFHYSHFQKIFIVFKESSESIQLYGLLVTSAFLMLASIGFGSVIVLYSLDAPFCLSPILIGYFLADCMFMQALGAIFALTCLQKVLSEIWLTQMGIASIISSLITIAFITKKWHMFIVPIVGCFGGVCMPVIRARMSKLVSADHQGALFSAVATLETLCTLLGAGIFNSLYPYTEKTFKFRGLCFLLMATILIVPALILCFISFQENSQKRLHNKLNTPLK